MKKRIIICCDGTWNEPEKIENDHIVPTNVLKMVRAVEPYDSASGIQQVVFYDQGVGTGALGKLDRSIGGGTGFGISGNIRDCYNFLANNYVEGDEIYLFGFSRGAYTVRSFSGMLAAVGLLSKNDLRYVSEAYAYYHVRPEDRRNSPYHQLITDLPRVMPRIKFLGVWDTVGALGAPTPILGKLQEWASTVWKGLRVGFHDCNLSPIVENAFQALAIDERRGPFHPSIWNLKNTQAIVQQMWFAGVHSNVGGGYPDSGLSDLALQWMVNRATECGLLFNDKYMTGRVSADGLGKLENSYGKGYRLLEYVNVDPYVRVLGEHLHVGEMIHDSVIARLHSDLSPAYQPENLLGTDGKLHIINEQGRDFLDIDQLRIPIYKEREQLRRTIENVDGTLSFAGVASHCQILDFTKTRGARLKVESEIPSGEQGLLDSVLTGMQNFVVVWCLRGEAGVRFV
jgi:hypothetical protein